MILFTLFVLLIPTFDYFAKLYVSNSLSINDEISTFIPFLKIVKVKNFGVAFGIFDGHTNFLIFITLIILILLFGLTVCRKIRDRKLIIPISFVIGGGIGNLIDRISYGYVLDYLKLTFFPPICNLSDYFICIGVIFLMFYYLKK